MDALTRQVFRHFPLWKRGIKGDLRRSKHKAAPAPKSRRAQIPLAPFFKGGSSGFVFSLIVAATIPARAAALSTAFTYQGQLQHSGTPANDTCDFQFTLFDAVSCGLGAVRVTFSASLVPMLSSSCPSRRV